MQQETGIKVQVCHKFEISPVFLEAFGDIFNPTEASWSLEEVKNFRVAGQGRE